ncbi:NUDIX hydrolase [Brachybacterium alimentarium]|uniref:NUDIX hydrolase n=1 Tax=Brachybacterium alimentarium TaxID=47845 RepID=UPI003FD4AE44
MRTRSTRLGAFGVICDGDRFLLVHQVESGRWSLPGGGVHFGEPPGNALIREVGEEVGLEVVRAELLGVHDNVYDPGDGVQRHGVRLLYRAHVEGVPRPCSPQEVDEARFFSIDDLPAPLTEWAAQAADLVGKRPHGRQDASS